MMIVSPPRKRRHSGMWSPSHNTSASGQRQGFMSRRGMRPKKALRILFGDVTNSFISRSSKFGKEKLAALGSSFLRPSHRVLLGGKALLSPVVEFMDIKSLCMLMCCNRALKKEVFKMPRLWENIIVENSEIKISQLSSIFMRSCSIRYPIRSITLDTVNIVADLQEVPYQVASRLHSLKLLKLVHAGKRASLLLKEILPLCPEIETLEICECPSVNVNAISSVISSNCGKLRKLTIAGCGNSLDRDQARALTECCPDIEQLTIRNFAVNDDCAGELLRLKALKYLDLTDNEGITGRFLVQANSKGLRSLILRDCTELNARGHLDEFVKLIQDGTYPALSLIDTSCLWASHGESMLKDGSLKKILKNVRPEVNWQEEQC
mmetsp:Transcript_47806/g.79195  ORF Transcript_47806/g.79195 Transcript_47806/m.79195 type:complete len:379 (-) Transcript_47806:900-2036(-)|eukprot:jgi/Bigna1/68945/fgenesh1_pg.7_\